MLNVYFHNNIFIINQLHIYSNFKNVVKNGDYHEWIYNNWFNLPIG